MDLGLNGKTAIITGGSAGIGLACAKALREEGVHVFLVGRSADRLAGADRSLQELVGIPGTPEVLTHSADMSEPDAAKEVVDAAIARWGRVNILINSAGAARPGPFRDLLDEAYLTALHLKFLGYVRMVRTLLPFMAERHDGRIVNIIGTAARVPGATMLPGSTANAAILNFTRGVSRDLATYGIRINAISPGLTDTDRATMLAQSVAMATGKTVEEAKVDMTQAIPLGRMVDPEEIASMALLLVSDRTRSMTGAEVIIDGGQMPAM